MHVIMFLTIYGVHVRPRLHYTGRIWIRITFRPVRPFVYTGTWWCVLRDPGLRFQCLYRAVKATAINLPKNDPGGKISNFRCLN